ncbi:hypothetical protein AB0L00_36210 [Actinoallomurus sp. NPDC052308]
MTERSEGIGKQSTFGHGADDMTERSEGIGKQSTLVMGPTKEAS